MSVDDDGSSMGCVFPEPFPHPDVLHPSLLPSYIFFLFFALCHVKWKCSATFTPIKPSMQFTQLTIHLIGIAFTRLFILFGLEIHFIVGLAVR